MSLKRKESVWEKLEVGLTRPTIRSFVGRISLGAPFAMCVPRAVIRHQPAVGGLRAAKSGANPPYDLWAAALTD